MVLWMGVALVTKHVVNTYKENKGNVIIAVHLVVGGISTAVLYRTWVYRGMHSEVHV